ncbi:MAG: hypothetical protein IPF94_12845 [Betaproteobacteria bacterium]|nr:hypothetical protein [Betaproteobacteria bacterium]
MSEFFKTSTTWVVDFRYDGHPRRWFRLLPTGKDAHALMSEQLRTLYGERAALVDVRRATTNEEDTWLRGESQGNACCPTGKPRRDEAGS